MKNTEVCTIWQETLKEIFGSIDRGVFWVEEGNKLCKARLIDRYISPHFSIFPFEGKNYVVIIYYEGKYKVEVRDAIGECSHAAFILLKQDEWCDSVEVLDNINFLIICQNGRYGVIDVNGNIAVPFEYDAIRPTQDTYLFEVYEDNMLKIYDASYKLEYPSKVIYEFIRFLDDPKNDCNLKAVEKFIKYELGDTGVLRNDYEFVKWLSRQYDTSSIAKIDKFLRRIMQKGQYGVNNSYTYEEKLLEFIYSVDACNLHCSDFEEVFAECGKKVEFQTENQLVKFIKDDANIKFFVKNYKKICEAFDIIA